MSLRDKRVERENKLLLKELPYYGCKDLASTHLQFNNLLTSALSGDQLDKLKSLFDLDLFYLNVPTEQQVKVSSNHSHFRCNYFSPHNFLSQKHRIAQSDNFFCIFYNNIWSLSKTLENLQNYLLNELDTHFSIIGVSETRIVKDKVLLFDPNLPGYNFDHVPTPLSAGGVGLYINELIPYRILEKESTSFKPCGVN